MPTASDASLLLSVRKAASTGMWAPRIRKQADIWTDEAAVCMAREGSVCSSLPEGCRDSQTCISAQLMATVASIQVYPWLRLTPIWRFPGRKGKSLGASTPALALFYPALSSLQVIWHLFPQLQYGRTASINSKRFYGEVCASLINEILSERLTLSGEGSEEIILNSQFPQYFQIFLKDYSMCQPLGLKTHSSGQTWFSLLGLSV